MSDAGSLLERAGFEQAQANILTAARATGPIPIEVYDAVIAYTESSIAALRIDPDPQATDALVGAEYQLELLKACRRFREHLGKIDERLRSRQRLHVPAPAVAG